MRRPLLAAALLAAVNAPAPPAHAGAGTVWFVGRGNFPNGACATPCPGTWSADAAGGYDADGGTVWNVNLRFAYTMTCTAGVVTALTLTGDALVYHQGIGNVDPPRPFTATGSAVLTFSGGVTGHAVVVYEQACGGFPMKAYALAGLTFPA